MFEVSFGPFQVEFKKNAHLLKNFVHFSNIFAQLGSRLPTVVHLSTFKFRQGNGVFLGGVGGVMYTYISQKGVCDCQVKNKGWGWYSGQNEISLEKIRPHLDNLYEKWAKGL